MSPHLFGGNHPYTSQASHASSYASQASHSSNDSIQELPLNDIDRDSLLEQPVLPWMKSESRNSIQSVDTNSLHVMKRLVPNNLNKKKRWSKHKWWLLLTNTMVTLHSIYLHETNSSEVVLLWLRHHVISSINYIQM